MHKLLLSPPVAFFIVLIFCVIISWLFSKLSYKRKNEYAKGTKKAYACGEDIPDHMAQPDYSQFFPFVFFFTIAHVATLMLTTIPKETLNILFIAITYLVVILISLFILLRK
ncbi:MAG: hypothetical protein PHG69_02540 [Candidatus Omnitrophica bacterium]|nr:hypothetical protein [Candidatus Omnitrophota bacterium]